MCGILASNHKGKDFLSAHAQLKHRGPDEQRIGNWGDAVYGFSRLAIRGLGLNGVQPFNCECGRWSIIYNGEISNWKDLKENLDVKSIGDCDGEVIPHMICKFGIESLHNLNGMYAIIAFDKKSNLFYAFRDSFGIKPLYFADDENKWYLSSEVKPLLQFKKYKLSYESIAHFKTFGFFSPEQSGFRGISLLPPGKIVRINDLGSELSGATTFVKKEPTGNRNYLLQKLSDLVARNSESDVKNCISYSSGFDSNLISILLANNGIKNEHVHISGITEFDETEKVIEISKKHNFSLSILDISKNDINLEDYFTKMDRLTYDGLNSYLISRAISEAGFKSFLTGHGGDEFLTGYKDANKINGLRNELVRITPTKLRKMIFQKFSLSQRSSLFNKKITSISDTFPRFYAQSRSIGIEPNAETYDYISYLKILETTDLLKNMSNQDIGQISHYMAGLSLLDLDQYSMAFSVEARPPLVDIEILKLLRSCGIRTKKQLAFELGFQSLIEIISRRKQGFSLNIKNIIENNLVLVQNKLLAKDTLDRLQISELQMRKEFRDRSNFKNGSSNRLWQYLTYAYWLENANQ
jgi:asparagine synthase (glutamine-hydrolysing)